MTKADLIEEVSRLADLTRKDSEIIVETIFDSIVSRSGRATKSKSAASAVSALVSVSRVSDATPKLVTALTSLPRKFRFSSPARN